MRIPRISLKFERLLHETERAYLFLINGSEHWMPKALCSNLNIAGGRLMDGTGGHGAVNIAPFKYQEMTGVIPQSMDELVIQEIDQNLRLNQIPDYDIIEPKGIYLKSAQVDKIIKIKRLRYFFVYGQMRTGKTVISTTVAESRYYAGLINQLIIIAPLRSEERRVVERR